jgi:hypothetical protein
MALVMYRAKDGAKFSIGGGLVMGMGGLYITLGAVAYLVAALRLRQGLTPRPMFSPN